MSLTALKDITNHLNIGKLVDGADVQHVVLPNILAFHNLLHNSVESPMGALFSAENLNLTPNIAVPIMHSSMFLPTGRILMCSSPTMLSSWTSQNTSSMGQMTDTGIAEDVERRSSSLHLFKEHISMGLGKGRIKGRSMYGAVSLARVLKSFIGLRALSRRSS